MMPYVDGPSDAVGSWPSNHMMLVTLLLNLPLVSGVLKNHSRARDLSCIVFACAYIAFTSFNRLEMGGHFLSDICSVILLSTCLLLLFDAAFLG